MGEGVWQRDHRPATKSLKYLKKQKALFNQRSIHESTEITEPIDSTDSEEFQEEVNRVIKSLSESYREIVDIKYSTHVFNGWKKGYSAIVLYR